MSHLHWGQEKGGTQEREIDKDRGISYGRQMTTICREPLGELKTFLW